MNDKEKITNLRRELASLHSKLKWKDEKIKALEKENKELRKRLVLKIK